MGSRATGSRAVAAALLLAVTMSVQPAAGSEPARPLVSPASLSIQQASIRVVESVPGRTRIRATMTVYNNGDVAAPTAGPGPGALYPEDYSVASAPSGSWRFGVEFDHDTDAESGRRIDHRWRWGFGSSVAPHSTGFSFGDIDLTTAGTRTFYVGLVQEYVAWTPWRHDPSALSVTVSAAAPDLRQDGPLAISAGSDIRPGGKLYLTVPVRNVGSATSPQIHAYVEGRSGTGGLWRADGASPRAVAISPGQAVTFTVQQDLWAADLGTWTSTGVHLWNDATSSYYGPLPANGNAQSISFQLSAPPPSSPPSAPPPPPPPSPPPPTPASLAIRSASITAVEQTPGRTRMKVAVTVFNEGGTTASTAGPPVGSVLPEDYAAPSAPARSWRIGVEFDHDADAESGRRIDHRWRWGFEQAIAPGSQGFAFGYVDLTTPGTRTFYVGLVQEGVAWTPWRYDPSAVAMTVAAPAPSSAPPSAPPPSPPPSPPAARPAALTIQRASVSVVESVPGRTRIRVDATVLNDGDEWADTFGPDPGTVLAEDDSPPPASRGTWRIGLEFDGDTDAQSGTRIGHRWRWGFGARIAPHSTGFTYGYVDLTDTRAPVRTFYVGLVHEYVEWVTYRWGPSATGVTVSAPRPLTPASLRIVSASLTPVEDRGRTTVKVDVVVHNDGEEAAAVAGPGPARAYSEADVAPSADRGTWRVGVEFEHDTDAETGTVLAHRWRWGFGEAIAGGQNGEVHGVLTLTNPGTRRFYVGLVHEQIEWITWEFGPSVRDITVRADPGIFAASYAGDPPARVDAGSQFTTRVTVTNTSAQAWVDVGTLNLSYHWLASDGTVVAWDGLRTPLGVVVLPDSSIGISLRVQAPAAGGDYGLAIDAVQEGVAWFSSRGVTPLTRRVTVAQTSSVPPSSLFSWPLTGAFLGARYFDPAVGEDTCGAHGHIGIDLFEVPSYADALDPSRGRKPPSTIRLPYAGRVVARATNRSRSDVIVEHRIPAEWAERLGVRSTTIYTYYAHLSRIDVVVDRDRDLPAGTPIGLIGNAGSEGSVHLHFAVTRAEFNSVCSANSIDPGLLLGVEDRAEVLGSVGDQDARLIPVSDLPKRSS